MTKARDFFRAFFLGVASMNDSSQVEVLYRRIRLRRILA